MAKPTEATTQPTTKRRAPGVIHRYEWRVACASQYSNDTAKVTNTRASGKVSQFQRVMKCQCQQTERPMQTAMNWSETNRTDAERIKPPKRSVSTIATALRYKKPRNSST